MNCTVAGRGREGRQRPLRSHVARETNVFSCLQATCSGRPTRMLNTPSITPSDEQSHYRLLHVNAKRKNLVLRIGTRRCVVTGGAGAGGVKEREKAHVQSEYKRDDYCAISNKYVSVRIS